MRISILSCTSFLAPSRHLHAPRPFPALSFPSLGSRHWLSSSAHPHHDLVSLLRSCSVPSAIPFGMHVHHQIIQQGFPFAQNPLLHMYCRCGALDEAKALFDRDTRRNAYSWDFILRAYMDSGCRETVLQLFARMEHEAIMPDNVICSNMLSAWSEDSDTYAIGAKIHARIVGNMLLNDIVLRTALVNFYIKGGHMHDARAVFHENSEMDEALCNSMIKSFVLHGCEDDALHLLELMQWEGLTANGGTFISLLSTCTDDSKLFLGKLMHLRVVNSEWDSDVCVVTALLSMYGRCGNLGAAWKLFANYHEKDAVICNAMIAAYAQNDIVEEALLVYGQMNQEGLLSTRVTYVSVLQACATASLLSQGKQVHACIKHISFGSEHVLENALISMYGSCGQIEHAQGVFEQMAEKDVVSWSAMIGACSQHGYAMQALQLLYEMDLASIAPNEGTLVNVISSHVCSSADILQSRYLHTWIISSGHGCCGQVGNALITMYVEKGSLNDAHSMFHQLDEKDIVSWNALISGYAQNGHGNHVLELFEHMLVEGLLVDSVTFASVLTACAEEAELMMGQKVHVQILSSGLDLDDVLQNAILNMYGKCGVIKDAHSMFKEMAGRNLISWNSIISGAAQQGDARSALWLLQRMHGDGVEPDNITFVAIITACSHAGLIVEAEHCLSVLLQNYGIPACLDHFNCMIDLFGRVGQLSGVCRLIENMPFQPTGVSYTSLLNACRQHIHMVLGQYAAEHAVELIPEATALPLLMSNIYALHSMEDF